MEMIAPLNKRQPPVILGRNDWHVSLLHYHNLEALPFSDTWGVEGM